MQILRYTKHTFIMREYTDTQADAIISSCCYTGLFYRGQQQHLWSKHFRNVTLTFACSVQEFTEKPAQTVNKPDRLWRQYKKKMPIKKVSRKGSRLKDNKVILLPALLSVDNVGKWCHTSDKRLIIRWFSLSLW